MAKPNKPTKPRKPKPGSDYDKSRVAVIDKGKSYVNLNTGQTGGTSIANYGNSRTVSAARLERLRTKANYDPATAALPVNPKTSPYGPGAVVGSYTNPSGATAYTTMTAAAAASVAAGNAAGRDTSSRVQPYSGSTPAPPGAPPKGGQSVVDPMVPNPHGPTRTPIYGEGNTTTTDLGGTRGKPYKGTGAFAAGQTGGGETIAPPVVPPTKGQAKNLKNRGHHKKGNVPKGSHINKQGNVVPNKGKQGKRHPKH
jgi:hypothetical protein